MVDAAAAVAAAVERGRRGAVYSIAGGAPPGLDRFLAAIVEAAVPRPGVRSGLGAPYSKALMVDSGLPVANARARAALGWAPRCPSVREGLRAGFLSRPLVRR